MMTEVMLASDILSELIQQDKALLLTLNGSDSLYLDQLAKILTTATTWIPFYIGLFLMVLKNGVDFRQVISVLLSAGLCVLLAGSIDDLIVKPMVGRWRPTHDPEIGILVDIVNGYRGGSYGFFSAHASNTFSIAILFCWMVRSRLLSVAVVLWSLTNCWTRMYLGVHFPLDILVGLIWGFLCGSFVYYLYNRLERHCHWQRGTASSLYTSTGYLRSSVDVPVAVLVFTLAYAMIRACLA